jgi:hypothetical protein
MESGVVLVLIEIAEGGSDGSRFKQRTEGKRVYEREIRD